MCSARRQSNGNTDNEICWQSELASPAERVAASFGFSKLTDLTITFPGQHDVIKAHRFVLAISSPVFERMFYGSLKEGKELRLPEDPPEAFKWLIHYIYYGNTNLPSVSLAVKVYHLAKKYQMDALVRLCSSYLESYLNERNVPLILDTALLHEDIRLQALCSDVISNSAGSVFSSSHLGRINRTTLRYMLEHHFDVKTEVAIFKGVVNWGKSQFGIEVTDPDGYCIRKEIEEFLPLIRFLTMSLDEFVKYVMPTNIITPEESSAILMNIKQVADVPLPPVCCKKRRIRKRCDFPKKKKNSRDMDLRTCLLSSPHSSPSSECSANTPNRSPAYEYDYQENSHSPPQSPASHRSPQQSSSHQSSSRRSSSRRSSCSSRHSSRSSRRSSCSPRRSSRSSSQSRNSSRSASPYSQSSEEEESQQ